MVRSRVVLVVVGVLVAAGAGAQPASDTGMVTPHVGVSSGGDARDRAVTPGASLAVLDASGLGAELDLAHSRQFDNDRFAESGITTLMLNVVGMFPHSTWRPFVLAGAGLLRVRGAFADGQTVANRTDWGISAGGGVMYMINEGVGIRGDARYFRYVQRHDDLPLSDNGFFDFWRTSIGVTFTWPLR